MERGIPIPQLCRTQNPSGMILSAALIPAPFIGLKEMAGTSGLAGANRLAADLEIRAPALARETKLQDECSERRVALKC